MGMEKCEFALPRGAMVRFFDEAGDNEITNGLFIGPEDNSEFIAVPLVQGAPLAKKVGERVLVRYGYLGAMVEFCSEIIEIIAYPVLLWRIRVPAEISRYELRNHKRIQCSVSAKIEVVHKGLFLGTIIRDISKSGARCVIQLGDDGQDQLSVDDAILLRCIFPGIVGEQIVSGNITDLDQTPGELTIGVHFTGTQAWVPPYH
jgi:hypothetical protein